MQKEKGLNLANIFLILTAAIWGFAFVAQRLGMQSLDPMSFNAIRFALGAIFVWLLTPRKNQGKSAFPWLLGIVLFIAASLQQVGMVYTGAGSAGFITGLYVVIVPLLGIIRKQRIGLRTMLAIALAVCGMFFINRPGNLDVSLGNVLVLGSAFFWAWHVQLVDIYSRKYETGYLAFSQFALCALFSALGAWFLLITKAPGGRDFANLGANVIRAGLPLLYGGVLSVGVAYTLQIKAQKNAEPAKAAVILCLEGVFALLGGRLVLHEVVDFRVFMGASLMLAAMLLSVIPKHFD